MSSPAPRAYQEIVINSPLVTPRAHVIADTGMGARQALAAAAAMLGREARVVTASAAMLRASWALLLEQAGAARPASMLTTARADIMAPRVKGREGDLLLIELELCGPKTVSHLESLIPLHQRCWLLDMSAGTNYRLHELCEKFEFSTIRM